MKNALYTLAILVTGMLSSTVAIADVKIKAKQSMGGQSYENTTYIKGKRQRSESMNGSTAMFRKQPKPPGCRHRR